jgi:hypothetical protein
VQVAQLRADALPPFARTGLVLGCGALGGKSALLGLLRAARFRLKPQAVALGRNALRELRDKLAGSGTLDEAAQVGHGAAHTLGLQPAGELVEQGLGSSGVAASAAGKAGQQLRDGVLFGLQQPVRKDQVFTTTTTNTGIGTNPAIITTGVTVW